MKAALIRTLQWVGGGLLFLVACFAFICASAAVVATIEQETIGTSVVSIVIALCLVLIGLAATLGAWNLVLDAIDR